MHRIHQLRFIRFLGVFFLVVPLLAACASQAPATPTVAPTSAPVSTAAPAPGTTSPATSIAAPATVSATTAAKPAGTKGGRLVVALDQVPPTLDPEASPSAITFEMTSTVFETLLYLDNARNLVPYLAESYDASADGKTYTFKLRTDVKFSDDTPFNAEAVKYNFDRIVDPKYKAGASITTLTGYDKTEMVDEFTARVSFKAGNAPFLIYAADSRIGMLSPTATKSQGQKVNETPVGSGPMLIKELVINDHAILVRNEKYTRRTPGSDHDGGSYLDEIYFKFVPENATRATTLESGETQMIHNILPQALGRFAGNAGYKVFTPEYPGTPRYTLLNVKLFPTDDIAVRKAIEYATNKDAIVNNPFKGTGTVAYAPLTQGTLPNPGLKDLYPYDPAKAKKVLEDAGWKAGADGIRTKDGKRLALVINAIDQGAGIDQFVELLQAQWREVGIDATIKAQARAPFYEDNYKCTTNAIGNYNRNAEWDVMFALFHSSMIGTNSNAACYASADTDKLLMDGKNETNVEKRKAIYLQAEQKVMEDAVILPMVDELSVWGFKSNVSGLIFDGYGRPHFGDVSLAK